jgi:uncharacterized membrane protein
MSSKSIITALSAVVALGMGSQVLAADTSHTATANAKMQHSTEKRLTSEMPHGFEKCYGIVKAGKNDCSSGREICASQVKSDSAKNAWIGVPKGTCSKIVGGSTTEGSAA